jgi:hypothetical protein
MRSRIAMATASVLLTAPIFFNGRKSMRVDRSLGDFENDSDLPGRLAVGHPLQHPDLAQRQGIGPFFAPSELERPIKRMPGNVLTWLQEIIQSSRSELHIEAGRDIVIVNRDRRFRLRRETAVGIFGW